MIALQKEELRRMVKAALKEDLQCDSDVTTNLFMPSDIRVEAALFAKENAVVAGLELFKLVFARIDKNVKVELFSHDGAYVKKNKVIARLKGPASSILKGERVALNFVSRLSGIATLTRRFVKATSHTRSKIYDTRKTTPLLRALEKYAVKVGGGCNHRFGLHDAILIKDNHLKALMLYYPHHKERLVAYLKQRSKRTHIRGLTFEIEVRNMEEFSLAIALNPDIIMLDNPDEAFIKKVIRIKKKMLKEKSAFPLLEASGKVDLRKARVFSRLGIDMISIGSLTHSPRSIDVALKIIERLH
jgi:nicotinate-nucleotide pyrophosphorylase (carboxylating)